MAFVLEDNGENKKDEKPSTKSIWVETFQEIWKWIKKIFNVLMKIGKWIAETIMKISKAMWEAMEKRFGDIGD